MKYVKAMCIIFTNSEYAEIKLVYIVTIRHLKVLVLGEN